MPQFALPGLGFIRCLSEVFPEERVLRGVAFVGFEHYADRVIAHLSNGTSLHGDVLIGADGVRSAVRRQLLPDVELVYAGYVGWRGMVEEWALSPATHAALFQRFAWV